ncbi:MAG: ABC transporter ATP-binding protein [Planctomycetota bacterium]
MSLPAIEISGVSKRFHIGARKPMEDNLVSAAVRAARSRLRRRGHDEELLWALKDVSFEVGEGECVGIIGPNGAGKSTLLKIISRLTLPTEGRVTVRGRIGSLLELGVGFNPELTGRENVFMAGVILGLTRAEVRARFDEIVDFSGVERFIDTPVKRYSNGMRLRLAFSTMSAIRPEILLVDEVLGVGDPEFQIRSRRRMTELIAGGRAAIVVSHNPMDIHRLCDRYVHLENGEVFHVATIPPETRAKATKAAEEFEKNMREQMEARRQRRLAAGLDVPSPIPS